MSNNTVGHQAEVLAADYLHSQGYSIDCLNWRTRYCEIDIIAEKDQIIYFIEVKSRQTNRQGSGADYITPRKLRQMRFAAEMWLNEHGTDGLFELAVISIDEGAISLIAPIDA